MDSNLNAYDPVKKFLSSGRNVTGNHVYRNGEKGRANNNSFINMNVTPRLSAPTSNVNFPDGDVPPGEFYTMPPVGHPREVMVGCSDRVVRLDYDIAPAVICAVCAVFGILYCFLGYRFLKATLFLTGFIFGSVVAYVICLEGGLQPLEGLIGLPILLGVIVGLLTMLIQQVGHFITGFSHGSLLAAGLLVIMEFFYHPTTVWVCIGITFLTGLITAILILYFQKSLTIFSTANCGSALIAVAIDYYVEHFAMVLYVYDRLRCSDQSSPSDVCWYSWVILGLWLVLLIIGILTQCNITAKGVNHKQISKRRQRLSAQSQKKRERESKKQSYHYSRGEGAGANQSLTSSYYHDNLEEQEVLGGGGSLHQPRQQVTAGKDGGSGCDGEPLRANSRYLHLYQVRRSNGDVISQSYIQNIQHKLSTAVRKKVVAAPPSKPPPQPSVECAMQSSVITDLPQTK